MKREEIKELKKIDLISYLKAMGFLPEWRSGDKAMFISPLRVEKNPSFYVQRSDSGEWFWKDWGTGDSGDIINFVMLYCGIDFKEAIKKIKGFSPAFTPSINKATVGPRDSMNWVNEFHHKKTLMGSQKMEMVRSYFLKRGVRYYSEMKCIPVFDRKERKQYIGIPVPFPLKIRGLELREINGESRKTWGKKSLWLLKRDIRRLLITESILDALAGEIILADQTITLCSINGVGNVNQLEDLFSQCAPRQVILALDADEAGRRATMEAYEIMKNRSVELIEFTGHIDAGEKDLHKLLMYIEERRQMRNERYDMSVVRRPAVFFS